ncbi:MAG: type II 3-dehydroquinate dehydratase [Oscillospiraceae bacterium]|nr:type II 3-dehydroquinate dehydratase [Oscillospiraceae bacterium]
MRILIINGPNLNLLGLREPEIYGRESYADLCAYCESVCADLGVQCQIFQSNHEGAIVDCIQSALGEFDGIVINPAAYTHTSVAILDALKAVNLPAVEVHLSDPGKREEFRRVSYVSRACEETFKGYGFEGYKMAVEFLALVEEVTGMQKYNRLT